MVGTGTRTPRYVFRQRRHQGQGAVSAAITTSWSNGQTEGQITKLKLVKRQMYGRAKLDLLQARLIGAT
jgi:transposase